MKRLFKSIFLLFYIAAYFIFNPVKAISADKISLTEINAENIQSTINEGELKISTIINDNGEIEVNGNINTKKLDIGYYTSFIFSNLNEDWRAYDGFAFHMNNNGKNILQLNLNLQSADGTKLSIPDGEIVLIENDNSNIIERVSLSNGSFEVCSGFDGMIYIPFKSMSISDDSLDNTKSIDVDYMNSLSEINLWGIVMTCSEDVEINFKISRFSLINKGEIKDKYLMSNMEITGSSSIMIPTVGESIGQYSISGSNNAVFEILDDIDYVDISEDGRLVVYNGAQPQQIRICAIDGDIGTTKNVELYKSWNEGMTYEDGVSMQILNPEEMEVILSNDNIFLNKTFIWLLRIGITLVSVTFAWLFFYYRKINR